jgi:hypothetical protein
LILFSLDFALGKMLSYLYFKQECGRQYRATYSMERTKEDILVFGSSKAYHHYIPAIIESKMNMSCYNTGCPGQFVLYNYATLKTILKRYSPKIIILDLMTAEFRVNSESYDRLSFLLPYYKNHKEIHSIVELRGPYEKYKLISSIYPYNSSILMIMGGNSGYFKRRNVDFKGYKPLPEVWNQPIAFDSIFSKYEVDNTKIGCYKNFIKECKNKGIQLFVIISPTYIKRKYSDYSISIARNIATTYNIKFYDFTNDTSFTSHRSLFADAGHLNGEGAKLYTNTVVNKILSNK